MQRDTNRSNAARCSKDYNTKLRGIMLITTNGHVDLTPTPVSGEGLDALQPHHSSAIDPWPLTSPDPLRSRSMTSSPFWQGFCTLSQNSSSSPHEWAFSLLPPETPPILFFSRVARHLFGPPEKKLGLSLPPCLSLSRTRFPTHNDCTYPFYFNSFHLISF